MSLLCTSAALASSRFAAPASSLPSLPVRKPICLVHRRSGASRSSILTARARPDVETEMQEKARASENGGPPSTSGNKTTEIPERIRDITGEMPQDQQRLLSQLYRISVQDPNMALMSFRELQAAADLYALLLWRPAELLNGRMAMIGFVAGVGRELLTGETIWAQLARNPFAYLLAYGIVVGASFINRAYGSPTKGIGPFTRTAELFNGRAAMVGYVILAYMEYNVELRRAALIYLQQLQHLQVAGIST